MSCLQHDLLLQSPLLSLSLLVSSLLLLPKKPSFPFSLFSLTYINLIITLTFYFSNLKLNFLLRLYYHHPIPQSTTPILCSHFIVRTSIEAIIPHVIMFN